ncbi:Ribonuclease Z [Porphyridium purpureum]|uniref:Ribonuclease Z n=1 Tax=Porphyridium purpureum TaxID=35688 RepID=A0A5J4YX42_PORPP|nr:Ribonuclease Z [Porphyridium purpureum]|eukprot:POR7963..scf209_3
MEFARARQERRLLIGLGWAGIYPCKDAWSACARSFSAVARGQSSAGARTKENKSSICVCCAEMTGNSNGKSRAEKSTRRGRRVKDMSMTKKQLKREKRRNEILNLQPKPESKLQQLLEEKARARPGKPSPLVLGFNHEDEDFYRALWEEEVQFCGPDVPDLAGIKWEDIKDKARDIGRELFSDPKFGLTDEQFAELPEQMQELLQPDKLTARFDLDTGEYVPTGVKPDWEKIDSMQRSWEGDGFRPLPLPEANNAWRLSILGTSSAVPTKARNVSAAAIGCKPLDPSQIPTVFLVDAGENTYRRLLDLRWFRAEGFHWLRYIFITHLHGDHVYGLPGVLVEAGFYTQKRRRQALLHPDEEREDPIIHIFGPYGTRGLLRTSLFFQAVVGIRFCVHELVPRDSDFPHLTEATRWRPGSADLLPDGVSPDDWHPSDDGVPPPHPEEVRGDDIHASEDGLWHLVDDERSGVKVTATPLTHRVMCYGYVFAENDRVHEIRERESFGREARDAQAKQAGGSALFADAMARSGAVASVSEGPTADSVTRGADFADVCDIDVEKARALGVKGRQFAVLRSGRPVTVKSTGQTVLPEQVAKGSSGSDGPSRVTSGEIKSDRTAPSRPTDFRVVPERARKVVMLGDNCDASLIVPAAQNADILVHEATFANKLRDKADISMHSTAGMAGRFAQRINAQTLVLTHFSSRYQARYEGSSDILQEGADEFEEVDDDSIDPDSLETDEEFELSDTADDNTSTPSSSSSLQDPDDADPGNFKSSRSEDMFSVDALCAEAREQFDGNVVAAYDFWYKDFPASSDTAANP